MSVTVWQSPWEFIKEQTNKKKKTNKELSGIETQGKSFLLLLKLSLQFSVYENFLLFLFYKYTMFSFLIMCRIGTKVIKKEAQMFQKDLQRDLGQWSCPSHKLGSLVGTLRMEKYILSLKHGLVPVNQ